MDPNAPHGSKEASITPRDRGFKLLLVVGTRPDFVKVAAVTAAMDRWSVCNERSATPQRQVLVYTGQAPTVVSMRRSTCHAV